MKKYLFILVALLIGVAAMAQEADEVKESWQKTITVPTSEAPIIEKLFTAWGSVFPGKYVEAFNNFKRAGDAGYIEIYEDFYVDFMVDFAPKKGYLEIDGSYTISIPVEGNAEYTEDIKKTHLLTAVFWNLKNGNKLFAISINDDGEIFPECALAFYEYDAQKGTLTPRPEITQKVLDIIDDDEDTFVILPKEGKDLKYYDFRTEKEVTIKWNGNGF